MITKKDVEHIAQLARIELSDEEKNNFEKDLSVILKFIEKLNDVNTTNTEPMTDGATLENVVREDRQIDKILEGESVSLMEQAPERKENWIKIKGVFAQVLK